MVIGGLIEDRNTAVEDKVPLFGSIPVLGKFFKSKGNDRIKRAVMFFVKVNIIDASGRRINGTWLGYKLILSLILNQSITDFNL